MAKVKKIKEEISGDQSAVNPAEEKRNALIEGLSGKLLTKAQLKKGGFGITERASQENAYQANIDEINDLGKQLGLAPIGLAHLRE